MLPGVFVTQRIADTVRVVQPGAGNELRRSSGALLRQPGELAPTSTAGFALGAPHTLPNRTGAAHFAR